jgi:hypothetical protein
MAKAILPPTVVIVSAYAGDDYFNETASGRSEQEAYWEILGGQIENVEQVLLISGDSVDDITARIAEKIAGHIEDGIPVATSAADFAERFGGYVPRLTRAEIAANRADYINDCRKDDCHPLIEAFTE